MSEAIRQGDIPGVQLRCRQTLDVAPDQAWSWLTDPRRLERWAAESAALTDDAGGGDAPKELRLDGDDEAGNRLEELGVTVDWEPPRLWRLAFRRRGQGWPAMTRLTIELSERAGGSEISILQQGFEHLPLSEGMTIWELYRRRWRGALDRLARASR